MVRRLLRVPVLASAYAPISCLIIFFMICASNAESATQVNEQISSSGSETVAQSDGEVLGKEEIFRRIGVLEEAIQEAELKHASQETMVTIFRSLGALYSLAGMFPKAEETTNHAIELMRGGPEDQLAEEFNALSLIHSSMGDLRKAEKDEMQALAIRQKIGDRLGLALTRIDLASVYLEENKNQKALEYATDSYQELQHGIHMRSSDRIGVQQVMAFSLCRTHRCSEGLPIMKRALDEANKVYGSESLSAAAQGFALGYVYWLNGDISDASDWMPHSLERMKKDIGWNSPLYVSSMVLYEQFLRKSGQREEARRAEAELHRIQSIVDVRALASRSWKDSLSPTH